MASQRVQVFGFVIGGSLLPAAKDDADPFEGQGSHGGLVPFAALELLLIVGFGPGAEADGVARKLHQALP